MSSPTQQPAANSSGGGIATAVILLAVAYLCVNRYQFVPDPSGRGLLVGDRLFGRTVSEGGADLSELRKTYTCSYGGEGRKELQSYWRGGHMYYCLRLKVSEDRYEAVTKRPEASAWGAECFLGNRFKVEVGRIKIPAAAFTREKDSSEWIAATGSISISAEDYAEYKETPKTSWMRDWFTD
jgi:hypothetical protein